MTLRGSGQSHGTDFFRLVCATQINAQMTPRWNILLGLKNQVLSMFWRYDIKCPGQRHCSKFFFCPALPISVLTRVKNIKIKIWITRKKKQLNVLGKRKRGRVTDNELYTPNETWVDSIVCIQTLWNKSWFDGVSKRLFDVTLYMTQIRIAT